MFYSSAESKAASRAYRAAEGHATSNADSVDREM